MKYKKVIISIGANINNPNGFHPMETCEKAILEISNFPIFIEKKSSWYISNPVPNSNQPKYYNCLIITSTKLNDISVLKILNNIEKKFGRIRSKKNMSRCIDLDILWWEDFHTIDKELILPHPRFVNRNFVITPLSEVLSKEQKIKKIQEKRWTVD